MRLWIPAAALALAILPLAFIHPLRIVGHSMEPALGPGSVRLALRAWCAGSPKRGEVWLVEAPEGGPAVKRVVGLPGERLEQRTARSISTDGDCRSPISNSSIKGMPAPGRRGTASWCWATTAGKAATAGPGVPFRTPPSRQAPRSVTGRLRASRRACKFPDFLQMQHKIKRMLVDYFLS